VTDREAELQLFFRQYAKVLNYVQDKRLALIEKIAKRKLDQMEEA
jgi:predicted transcriptional regulator